MFCTYKDSTFTECRGDIVFSPTVFQTAESLTDEQRAEFGLYLIVDMPHPELTATQKLGDPSYQINGATVERTYPAVDKSAEELAQRKQADLKAVRAHAQSLIIAKYPLWVQINYANGVYPESGVAAMAADIAAVITESNRLEDAIEAGTPATANWPVI